MGEISKGMANGWSWVGHAGGCATWRSRLALSFSSSESTGGFGSPLRRPHALHSVPEERQYEVFVVPQQRHCRALAPAAARRAHPRLGLTQAHAGGTCGRLCAPDAWLPERVSCCPHGSAFCAQASRSASVGQRGCQWPLRVRVAARMASEG